MSKPVIIALVGKGGVGKTSISALTIRILMEKYPNKKILAIDADPAIGLATALNVSVSSTVDDIRKLFVSSVEDGKTDSAIKMLSEAKYRLVDSLVEMDNLSFLAIGRPEAAGCYCKVNAYLKEVIGMIASNYDFIVIDCPPALGMLTVNAMTAADSVLVPIQCEFYALDGLSQLIYTIELIQESLNPDLYIEGVVFTMYDARTNLSLQVVENVKDNLKQTIYKTIIPRNVRLAEAPSYGLPINLYDKRSSGAEAYRMLADEVIENAK